MHELCSMLFKKCEGLTMIQRKLCVARHLLTIFIFENVGQTVTHRKWQARLTCRYSVGLARPRGSNPLSPGRDPSSHCGLSVLGSQSASAHAHTSNHVL